MTNYPWPPVPQPPKKKSKAKWWVIGGVVLLIGAVGSSIDNAKKAATAVSTPSSTVSSTTQAPEPTPSPQAPSSVVESPLPPPAPTEPAAPVEPPAPTSVVPSADPDILEWSSGKGRVTLLTATWNPRGVGEFTPRPNNGGYLTIDVTIEAVEGTVPYNPFYFSLKNDSGQEFDIDVFTAGHEPSLKSGELVAPDKARGFIAFDVANEPVKLTLTDTLLQPMASWRIHTN
jgi:hypothetical protein